MVGCLSFTGSIFRGIGCIVLVVSAHILCMSHHWCIGSRPFWCRTALLARRDHAHDNPLLFAQLYIVYTDSVRFKLCCKQFCSLGWRKGVTCGLKMKLKTRPTHFDRLLTNKQWFSAWQEAALDTCLSPSWVQSSRGAVPVVRRTKSTLTTATASRENRWPEAWKVSGSLLTLKWLRKQGLATLLVRCDLCGYFRASAPDSANACLLWCPAFW